MLAAKNVWHAILDAIFTRAVESIVWQARLFIQYLRDLKNLVLLIHLHILSLIKIGRIFRVMGFISNLLQANANFDE